MYYGLFESDADVCKEFQISEIGGHVVFAAYECEHYEGSAEVIFISKGKFWHVSGGHCSCYGLEDQWNPEEMPLVALRHIVDKSTYGLLSSMRSEVREAINVALARIGIDDTVSEEAMNVALRIAYD